MSYGVPYMGSKNGIAEWVIDNLPDAEVLVDLFAGGVCDNTCGIDKRSLQKNHHE